MPKRGNTTLIDYPDEPRRSSRTRRIRRFHNRLHREVRYQREAIREQFPGRKPPEWIARHNAMRKIMIDEQRVEPTDQ
jgi:hypothetical protein